MNHCILIKIKRTIVNKLKKKKSFVKTKIIIIEVIRVGNKILQQKKSKICITKVNEVLKSEDIIFLMIKKKKKIRNTSLNIFSKKKYIFCVD